MFHDIENEFPEIKTEAFLKHREQCWAIALEAGDWKAEYRKKELALIRDYFFTGHLDDDMPLKDEEGSLLLLFPVQNKKGYDYFYKKLEVDADFLESSAFSSLISWPDMGLDEEAQLAYWDYHLGKTFSSQGIRHCKNGPVVFMINPSDVVGNILGHILDYFLDGEVYARFFAKRLNYLFEAFAALKPGDEALSREKIELKLEIFQMILNSRKDIDPTDERIAALNEFEALMESTPGLPPVILAKWKQAKAETNS